MNSVLSRLPSGCPTRLRTSFFHVPRSADSRNGLSVSRAISVRQKPRNGRWNGGTAAVFQVFQVSQSRLPSLFWSNICMSATAHCSSTPIMSRNNPVNTPFPRPSPLFYSYTPTDIMSRMTLMTSCGLSTPFLSLSNSSKRFVISSLLRDNTPGVVNVRKCWQQHRLTRQPANRSCRQLRKLGTRPK